MRWWCTHCNRDCWKQVTQTGALNNNRHQYSRNQRRSRERSQLTHTGNAFTGKLLITTNDADVGTQGTVNVHGGTTNLILGTSTIDGNLTLLSGGEISG